MAVTAKKKYFEGVGSRKRSHTRVRMYAGKETSTVNSIPLDEYFKGHAGLLDIINRALVSAGLADKMYFSATVAGGGIIGQAGAIRLGLAKAIVRSDPAQRAVLAKEGLLSRDPREVERKKYFFRKARKRPQFSKR